MRYGSTLLAGLGFAGTLGGLAVCVLIFLSAYLALDDRGSGAKPREHRVIRLPSVPEAEVPRVALARPSRRAADRVPPAVGQVTAEARGAVDALTPRR